MEITNPHLSHTKKAIEDLFSFEKIFGNIDPKTIKEIKENLKKVEDSISDERTIELLIETIKNYKLNSRVVKEIVKLLALIAKDTKSEEDIKFFLKIFLKEKIKEALTRYNSAFAEKIVRSLGEIVYYTKSEEIADLIAEIVEIYTKTRAPFVTGEILQELRTIAYWIKDAEVIKSIIETLKTYTPTPEAAETIVNLLSDIAYETKSKEVTKFIREIYSKENVRDLIITSYYSIDSEFAKLLAKNLGKIAYITQNEETVDSAVRIFGIYNKNPEIAKEIQIELGKIINFIESKKAIESVLKILEIYYPKLELVKEIIKILARAVETSENENNVELLAEIYSDEEIEEIITKYHSISPDFANKIAWEIRKFAFWTNNKKAVKKFCDIISDQEIGKYIANNGVDMDTVLIILRYYGLIKKEGVEGIKKAEIARILGIDPTIPDFDKKLKDIVKKKFGINPENLTSNELRNVVISFYELNEDDQMLFKRVINLISKGRYLEDEKVKKIADEMKKYGINVDKLTKGDYWIYRVDGAKFEHIDIDRNKLTEYLIIGLVSSRDPNKEKEAISILTKFESEEKIKLAQGLVRSNKELKK
ncbi:MAG: hypothetical protein QXL82_02075 [Candidatus Aenigmatarchaeota archaeon]